MKTLHQGQVRVIGGQWRGRRLSVIDHSGLRPTGNRLKETLFNWLMPVIAGSRCLDCFAGSGSLGLEALSRQALAVTLIEKNPSIFATLTQNAAGFNSEKLTLIQHDTLHWLSQKGTAFNVIFLDPPFHQQLLSETVLKLESNHWLADEAWIYIESEHHYAQALPATWRLYREKIAGQVTAQLYHRKSVAP